MIYPIWQATIQNQSGDIVPSAQMTVINEATGTLATIYSTRTGGALANPFFASSEGFAKFFAPAGIYRITAKNTVTLEQRTWEYVELNPPATTDKYGSVLLATDAQAKAGTAGVLPDAEQVRLNHIAQVATIADLSDLEPAFDGQQVELLGHSVAGIGGGVFYSDYSSVATDDNGVTIVTAGGKRWLRKDAGLSTYTNVLDYGFETGIDQTDELVTFLSGRPSEKYFFPSGMVFDRSAVINALNTGSVIVDFSGYGYASPGETTKSLGILSKDEAISDTHWLIMSDHHAILELNNAGGAGSTSASERKASFVWAVGNFTTGPENKRGQRPGWISQYTKLAGIDASGFVHRVRAPWVAIDANYERWGTGLSITTGDYCVTSYGIYVAASTGITGATEPSHASGTASDGGVSWTWVDDIDRSIFILDEYNRLLIGSGSYGATFRQKVSKTDPSGGNGRVEFAARGVSKTMQLKLIPTNASDVETPVPFFLAQHDVGVRIMRSNGSSSVGYVSDNALYLSSIATTRSDAADGDTTPDVSNANTLFLNNSSATTITGLDGGFDGKRVRLISRNGNTTIGSSSTLLLTGSTNVTLTAYSSIDFEKIPTGISDRWVEVGRSIK